MKKTAVFLYLVFGLLSCRKDVGFDKSTVLRVKTQYILKEGGTSKAFVFLSNAEHKVIGSTEVSNYGTFDIQNDIPYDGGAFDVHYVRAYQDATSGKWSFLIESYGQVDATKIYLKGKEFVEPPIAGKANFHIDVTDYDYYYIQALSSGTLCGVTTGQSCSDFSLSLRENGDGVLLSFFNEAQNVWRYKLLTSVQVGDDITISDDDLPFLTVPVPLDYDIAHATDFNFLGFLEDHYQLIDDYYLGIIQHMDTPPPTHVYAPVAVLSKFATAFSMYYPDLGESYYFNAFGGPVFSYHPQPADFVASTNEQTVTLVTPGNGISYYRMRGYKKATPGEDIAWNIYSDLSQPFTIPEMPKEVEKLMSKDLKQADFEYGIRLASVNDSRYATYQDYINAVLISEALVERKEDFTTEEKWKKF